MADEEIGAHNKFLKDRRARLKECVSNPSRHRAYFDTQSPEPVGIAFSGGGIRSATISLGITQLLARRGRLYGFDYMSTASGGGYFGSFLRSLFLPQSAKGGDGRTPTPEETVGQFDFAHRVLSAGPKKGDVPASNQERNPIWWLRENGRYLAPNGATDYLMALSYIARNWTATLYVIALAMAAFFIALQIASWPIVTRLNWEVIGYSTSTVSPFLIAPIFLAALSVGVGVGYWMTQGMQYDPVDDTLARINFAITWLMTAVAFAISVYFEFSSLAYVQSIYDWVRGFAASLPEIKFVPIGEMPMLAQAAFFAGMLILGMAVFSSFLAFAKHGFTKNPTPPVRRLLTRWSTVINQWVLALLAVAVIDTLALMLRGGKLGWSPSDGASALWPMAIYPAIAYLIKKLPEWFSGSDNVLSRWLGKHMAFVAVVASVTLYGSMAVFVDLTVHMALWEGPAWAAESVDWQTFVLFTVIVLVLALMTGFSTGFVNLSSLHAFYASRLTRAYLGASNRDRIDDRDIEISDGHAKDFIDARRYSQADIAAPIHLINLTLNQTNGKNQLVRRDRKGQRFAIGPDGISIDGALNDWEALRQSGAEPFSIGQLAAISGAAASSAMGRQTTLGGALGLTFANVRLGYWWARGKDRLQSGDNIMQTAETPFWHGPFQTFIYLFNEMTSRFSLDYPHYYLSDGGHSENSGALELLQRGCKFILVSDNGQDEKFLFVDLEILIRTARIDLGVEINVATPAETKKYVGDKNAEHFFNMDGADWREKAEAKGGKSFALLLRATRIKDGTSDNKSSKDAWIVWLKPRVFAGIATDIEAYAIQNEPFPHQTTIDQFFDEAQWESYRRLGYEMASRLFSDDKIFGEVPTFAVRSDLVTRAR